MQEVNEDLMEIAYEMPEYAHLLNTLVTEMKTKPRQVLSHHTTTSCQPRRSAAPMGSLKDCGLDQAVPDKRGIRVRLTFQHSYELGDGRSWSYLSRPCRSLKKAQSEAYLKDADDIAELEQAFFMQYGRSVDQCLDELLSASDL